MNQAKTVTVKSVTALLIMVLLCLSLFAVTTDARADPTRPAGWIDSFIGTPDHYVLQRGSNRLPVKFYMPVHDGDLIIVNHVGHSLVLALSENDSVLITVKNSPYRAKALYEAPTLAGNLMDWAGDWLTGLAGKSPQRNTAMLVTRSIGSRLHTPLLNDGAGKIAAGKTGLCLAWVGGRPKYRITVTQPYNHPAPLLDVATSATSGCWRIPKSSPGEYGLIISDDSGYRVKTNVHMVSEQEIPRLPQELSESSLSSEAKTTLYAAWLASLRDTDWALQAYQLVVPLANIHPPAASLVSALEEGSRPQGMEVSR